MPLSGLHNHMPDPCPIHIADPAEWEPALRLVFQHLPEADRQNRVANALTLVARKELDPQGIVVVRRGRQLAGAMVSMLLPGAAGLVWPPQAWAGPDAQAIEDGLVRHASAGLRRGSARMAQAILAPAEASLAAPLLRNGFRHITSLWYFRYDLSGPSKPVNSPSPAELRFDPYPSCDASLFVQTLIRTYEGTLDCPEVNGVRSPDEILAGHQGQGDFDPNRWWLIRRDGAPAGVLLLTHMPDWQALDVAYLGVVPEARRRGVGRAATAKAIAEAGRAGVRQLTLAVDGRNRPAWDMYRAAGFVPHEKREVYLAVW
jgi:ribosomal protein S18 acetylase RimI-like enzyme